MRANSIDGAGDVCIVGIVVGIEIDAKVDLFIGCEADAVVGDDRRR
jgi:hypothetical protein